MPTICSLLKQGSGEMTLRTNTAVPLKPVIVEDGFGYMSSVIPLSVKATADHRFASFFLGYPCRHHTMASMEPAQLTAVVVSIVNTSPMILEYVQDRAKRRQHEDDCDEVMDTHIPESMGCGNWDIMAAVRLVDTVGRRFWAWQTSTDWWDRIGLQVWDYSQWL
nr:uncharacterized protein LOC125637998 isoform X2 [Caretta caretta]